ncbi:MAG: hypothetical protein RBU23_04755 [Candidatus Auribacterota bacterium]|jgi:hypothetical protein|nr:hypothetical protein [Candidatus Auribacterota bacterium]
MYKGYTLPFFLYNILKYYALGLFFAVSTLWSTSYAKADVMLTLHPVSESFFEDALSGTDPCLPAEGGLIVIGTFSDPLFAVSGVNSVSLFDSDGNRVALTAERSSLYSEFDDGEINSMRIKFILPSNESGIPVLRLTWGDTVSSDNSMVDSLAVYDGNKDSYRHFTWRPQPDGDDSTSYSATLDVIVDNKADTYYLWYLLPVALIFTVLLVRRFSV